MRDKNEVLHVEGAKAGSKQKQPYRAAVTSTTNQKMRITYGLSEGEIAGFNALGNFTETDMLKRIFLDGTPIMSEEGERLLDVNVEFRSGTQDQSVISGLPSVTIENGVNVEVKLNAPVSRSFTRTETTSFDVRISVPQLWDGDAEGNSRKGTIQFRIEVSVNNGPFNVAGTFTVNEKIIDGWSQTYNFPATKGSAHTIRIVRMNSERVNEFSANKLIVDSIVEVTDVRLRYPRTALLYLEYNADQFSNIPKLEVQMFGKADILVPANYNPISRVYSTTGVGTSNGVWDGTFKRAYTDNPVWIWLDLITSKRYGTGNRITIDMVDKWELYGLSRYCDQLVPDGKGGQEPRFTCNNLYLQKSEDAFKVLKDLTAMFRSKTVWDGTKIRAVADVPRTPALAFTSSNCKDIVYSSVDTSAQHNLVNVQYYDKTNRFASKIEMRRDARNIVQRDRVVEMNFTALGCTSAGQAQRIAQYILVSELNEQNIVSFTTGLEGSIPKLNDVFYFADEYVAGRVIGGRVVSITGQSVKLDREVPLAVGTVADPNVQLILNRDDGTTAPIRITSVAQDKRTVYLQFAPPASVGPELQWTLITPQVMPQMFYITDIEYNDKDKTYNISGMQYLESKYGAIDGDARIVAPPISINENSMLKAPATLSARYFVKIVQDISVCDIEVSWAQSANATKYQLEMRKDNGEWRIVGSYTSLTAELENMYTGIYEFRITAYDTLNNASQYTYSSPLNVQGKVLPPPALSVYTVQGILLGFQHNWVYPAHTEDSRGVRIRRALQDPAVVVGQTYEIVDVAYPSNSYTQNNVPSNTTAWFSAAIVDKYGVIGAYTDWVKASVNDDPDQIMDLIEGSVALKDLDEELRKDLTDTKDLASTANQNAESAKAAANAAKIAADNAAAQAGQNATAISNEAAARIAADKVESDARIAAVATLQDGLNTETQQRKDAVSSLTQTVTNNKASTDASIANVQNQVTSQASTLASQASQLSSLDARTTTAETNIANVTQKADAAVAQGQSNATAITTLRTDLSGGKGKNAIIAPFSDPQVLSPYITGTNRTVTLVKSPMRINGKAYDVTFNTVAGNIYFGSASNATVNTTAAGTITGGKRYMLSAYLKNLDATKQAEVNFMIYWFRRTSGGISITQALLVNQTTNITRITPSNDGGTISFKSVTAPSDAFAFIFLCNGNGVYNVAGSRILIDMLMLEEVVGVDVPASTWTAGSPDLGAIQTTLDANSSAITSLNTQVSTLNGTTTSQGQAITTLQGNINTINGQLANKAETSAVATLSQKVTANEGNISTHTQQLASLTNSVTTLQGDISKKADAGALTTLSNRVDTAEGKITSQGNSITALTNKITNNDLSNLVLNPDFVDPKSDWTSGVIVDAVSAAPNPPSPKALRLNNRDSYYGPFVKCNVGDMFYVSAWFATPNTSATASAELGFNARNSVGNYSWYSVVIKSTDKNAWGMVEGYFTVPNGMVDIRPWLLVSIAPSEAAGQQWHVTNIQVRNITGNKKLATDLQATSSALSTLDSKVTNIDGRVTSASNNIASLNNSVANINSQLATKADSSAITNLQSQINTTNDRIATVSDQTTVLKNQLGNTTNYTLVTFRNGSAVGMPKDGGIHSYKGKINGFGRGLNLIVFNNGDVVSCTAYDTYGDVYAGCNEIYAAINALASGTYFAIVGTDNIGAVGAVNPDTNLRALLLSCGAGDRYFRSWNWNALPIFVGRKDLDAGNGILGMFDSTVGNQWIEYPLTFVNGAPMGMGDARNVTAQLDANAAAISSLSNTVTQHGNDIVSLSQQNTQLNNSIITINSQLATKADSSAITNLQSQINTTNDRIATVSDQTTVLKNQLGNTTNYTLVTFRNGSAVGMPKDGGIHSYKGKINGFGRGLNLIVFNNGDVVSCTAYDTYGDVYAGCNEIYAAINALASGTYFAIVGTDNIGAVGAVNPDTNLRALLLSCGAGDRYFRSWNWNALPIFVGRKDLDAGNGILGMFDSTVGNQWIEYPLTFVNGAPMGMGDARNVTAQLDANAAAISSLSNTVTQHGNDIVSLSQQNTQLNNSIITINSQLATKADSSALSTLESRVAITEGTLTSHGQAITQVQASADMALNGKTYWIDMTGHDPNLYYPVFIPVSAGVGNAEIAIDMPLYTNNAPWSSHGSASFALNVQWSVKGSGWGANPIEREITKFGWAWTQNGQSPAMDINQQVERSCEYIYLRGGTKYKFTCNQYAQAPFMESSYQGVVYAPSRVPKSIGATTSANASAITTLDAKVDVVDGKAQSAANATTLLRTDVDGHTSALQLHAQSINGIESKYTVKIDNNGYISGYGLISTTNNGIPTSAFTVNADFFSVGKVGDSTSYKPFVVVTSSNQVIDGATYPEVGVYMRQAFMSKLSVTTAHIKDLSVTTGKIANLAVDSAKIADAAITTAKIGDLQVDTLKIKDRAVTAPHFISKAGITPIKLGPFNYSPNTYPVTTFLDWGLTGLPPDQYAMVTIRGAIKIDIDSIMDRVSSGSRMYILIGDTYVYDRLVTGGEQVWGSVSWGYDPETGQAQTLLVKTDSSGNLKIKAVFGATTFNRYVTVRLSHTDMYMNVLELKK